VVALKFKVRFTCWLRYNGYAIRNRVEDEVVLRI